MRILHLFSDWKWTGPAEPALMLANRLAGGGHDVFFASSSPPHPVEDSLPQRAEQTLVQVVKGPYLEKHLHFRRNLQDVRFLRRWIREASIDVVHCHRDQDHFVGGAAARLAGTGTSVVRTNHTALPMNPYSVRHRILLHRLTDHLIEVSRSARDGDRERFSLSDKDVTRIESAVDLDRYRPGGPRPPRESLGLGADDVVVGIVARVQKKRRFEVLFEAFQRALEVRDDLRLLIVGRGTRFDEVARGPVARLGIGDRVVLAGYRGEDFPAVLACFDVKVFLVPGTDGSCRAVREAMASGVPVIAARRGMLPELVEPGAGIVLEDTPAKLSEAILRLAGDEALRHHLGRGARQVAERRFDPALHAYHVEEVYKKVRRASRRPAPPPVESPHVDEAAKVGEWPAVAPGGIEPTPPPDVLPAGAPVDVSIVLVNWNGVDLLPDCFASLPSGLGRLNHEVLFVDNGSTDGSEAWVARKHPRTKRILNPENRGFGAANNQAFREARGAKILLLNTDARLRPGTMEALSDFLDAHPKAGAVTPALVDGDGKPQNAFDNFPTLATELLNKGLLRRLFPGRYPSKSMKPIGPVDVESALGASLMIRKEALDRAGHFDEGFFFFLEETDLCFRLRKRGFTIHYLPSAVAVHLGGGSKAHAPAEAWIEYYRSLYRYFRKHERPWVYNVLRAGRFLKLILNTAGTYLLLHASMGMHPRATRKFPVYLRLLWWHLRLCPKGEGLRRRDPGGQIPTPTPKSQ
ncbi:MAG: glycosyltransferase [Planctomycetota bacterium]|jgi:GT2 family glycosyltransferase/glycosyltransferase involved in cell wall biosynthesis